MIKKATFTSFWVLLLSLMGANAFAQTYVVNAVVREFRPDILYIKPGDTVQWQNMASHDTASVKGLIPKGAKGWTSQIGQNFSHTFNKEGVYAYICQPHIGFGMSGVIVVGKPVGIDADMKYARAHLQGPKRRLIGKLLKVQRAAKQAKK
jgi:pseudoazurin